MPPPRSLAVLLGLAVALSRASTGVPASATAPADGNSAVIRAAEAPGPPWIVFEPATPLFSTSPDGETVQDSGQRGPQNPPLALAAGDFDEDGIPDLAIGRAAHAGGVLEIHPGSGDPRVPFSPRSWKTPLPNRPEFVEVGDWDADGHLDVVTARSGSETLVVLSGDGSGKLAPASEISLPGSLTTLASGEMNRPDGLADLAVGMIEPPESFLLCFSSPQGALRAVPERVALPAPAGSVEFGHFDSDNLADVAVAAGKDLALLAGRAPEDRSAPRLISRSLPFEIVSLAAGDFEPGRGLGLALLAADGAIHVAHREAGGMSSWAVTRVLPGAPFNSSEANRTDSVYPMACDACPHRPLIRARVSSRTGDDLIRIDPTDRRLTVLAAGSGEHGIVDLPGLSSGPLTVLPLRLNGDALDDLLVLTAGTPVPEVLLTTAAATFTVTTTANAGPGSLRQALLDANASAGADSIVFAIPGTGPWKIQPASPLPVVTDPVTLDATTQPSFAGSPVVELDGSTAGAGVSGLEIAAGSSVVRGFAINRFTSSGLLLRTAGGNRIEGNRIGTDLAGAVDLGNTLHGIHVSTSSGNTIGGTTSPARNVLSGNGNYGIAIMSSSGNHVEGNFIGVTSTGSSPLGNTLGGVYVQGRDPPSNVVGGATAGTRNVISSNVGTGVTLGDTLAGQLIQGNLIGTDASGSAALGNGAEGVRIVFGSCCNTVGGTTPAARNIISGNGGHGLQSDYHPNVIQGNFIGTSSDGSAPLGNSSHGVFVNFSGKNSVGGAAPGAGNTVAFNGGDGVFLAGSATVSSNRLFSNAGLGLDLSPDGVTSNDPLDADSGVNGLQNFPLLGSVANIGAATRIDGTMGSKPSTVYRLEFFSSTGCDPSGNGEAESPLGFSNETTDGSGSVSFSRTLPVPVTPGHFVTATATDPDGNTSEISPCRAVMCAASVPAAAPDLRVERTLLTWTPAADASATDLIRGSLAVLRTTGGDFTAATSECLANDLASTTLPFAAVPPAGEPFWFLARGVNCAGGGTWDTGHPSQVGSRNSEITASPGSCP